MKRKTIEINFPLITAIIIGVLIIYLAPNLTKISGLKGTEEVALIEKISFNQVLEKLSNKESFYLYIDFKEDPNRSSFKTIIESLAKENSLKIYQTDNSIFFKAEKVTGATLDKRSTLQFYSNGEKQDEIVSGYTLKDINLSLITQ